MGLEYSAIDVAQCLYEVHRQQEMQKLEGEIQDIRRQQSENRTATEG
jgi:hypothetical protein